MNKLIIILAILIDCSGCCSYMVYKNNEQKLQNRAIRAVRVGEDGAGIGIDIAALDVIKEGWVSQLLAGIGDAGIIYGAKELIENEDKEEQKPINLYGNNNVLIINEGSGSTFGGQGSDRDYSVDNSGK